MAIMAVALTELMKVTLMTVALWPDRRWKVICKWCSGKHKAYVHIAHGSNSYRGLGSYSHALIEIMAVTLIEIMAAALI